jgi:acyl-[acyl-carrier-protein]-phospholipid O-acyltransferase/long-chain-fatty-acid--[acyl-carrier-protein] ligase
MFSSLRLVISASSKLAAEVKERFESRFKKVVYEGYGTSETSPLSSVNIPDSLDTQWWTIQQGHKVGSVGMALPGTMFRVVDPATLLTVPANECGQVLIGGGQIVTGYLNQQAALEDNIVMLDGIRWYKTDDVGRLDEDGFLSIEIVG